MSTTKKRLPAKYNIKETIIKKLIDDVLNDTLRPKINLKILPRNSDKNVFVTEKIRLPKHLTIENV